MAEREREREREVSGFNEDDMNNPLEVTNAEKVKYLERRFKIGRGAFAETTQDFTSVSSSNKHRGHQTLRARNEVLTAPESEDGLEKSVRGERR